MKVRHLQMMRDVLDILFFVNVFLVILILGAEPTFDGSDAMFGKIVFTLVCITGGSSILLYIILKLNRHKL